METQWILVHKWKFLRFEACMGTRSDTMLNYVNIMIISLHEFKWKRILQKRENNLAIDCSINQDKIADKQRQNWNNVIKFMNQ